MNPKHIAFVVALGVASLFSGCAAPQVTRISADRALYDSWPVHVKEAIAAGRVEPGMTRAQVEMAWGKPSDISPVRNSKDAIWIYRTEGYVDTVMNPAAADAFALRGPGVAAFPNPTVDGRGRVMGLGLPGLPLADREWKGVAFRDGVAMGAIEN